MPKSEKEDNISLVAASAQTNAQRSGKRPQRWIVTCLRVAAVLLLLSLLPRPRWTNPTATNGEAWIASLIRPHCSHVPSGRAAEEEFLKIPNPSSALESSRYYAAEPHIAGNARDLETAKEVVRTFQREFGLATPSTSLVFDAGTPESRSATLDIPNRSEPYTWIDTYYTLLNYPVDSSLEVLDEHGKPLWSADLSEHVDDDTDPEAYAFANAIPPFHGLSKNGSAKGPLVYADYGLKEDYNALVESGVDLTGKIVIVRYGKIFRGLKIKFAQELGAAGVLIYSDPRDDGSVTVANGYSPYPHGPARNPRSVQRGSVQFLSIYPGDPTTPGVPSYSNASRTDGTNIPTIPSLPISWQNAERLLEELRNTTSSSKRTPTYTPNASVDDKVAPIWNAMAVIPGQIRDEVVVMGNHRDAWVLGAADPTSGTVSWNEVIRGYGALYRKGWRPLRTILFASWDAEEYGLIGSTEYGEDFPEWIKDHVVAYINLDVSVAGSRFSASASPSLADLVRNVAEGLEHPTNAGRTLWDATEDVGPYFGNAASSGETHSHVSTVSATTGIGALGSGSDFTVFLQRLGVASVDLGFGGTPSDAVYHYHSIYDSEYWQENFGDQGFHKHVAIAKHLGILGLRFSDSVTLPINISRYSFELEDYVNKFADIAGRAGHKIDLNGLQKAIAFVQKRAAQVENRRLQLETELHNLLRHIRPRQAPRCPHDTPVLERTAGSIRRINRILSTFEQGFISDDGIGGREWYKHLVVAPGRNLGYGATTLPSLTEAITLENNASLARIEVARLEELVTALGNKLSL